ncbi:hypothetical protein [Ruminococcus callidus]|uniref:hypothetical protein n=1 Tax=Ruminococcus callidus TaxID=40519 RepID=UPI0035230447
MQCDSQAAKAQRAASKVSQAVVRRYRGSKRKKQTRQSDAKEVAERLADHVRSADAAGLSYGMYMAKKFRTGGNQHGNEA